MHVNTKTKPKKKQKLMLEMLDPLLECFLRGSTIRKYQKIIYITSHHITLILVGIEIWYFLHFLIHDW